MCNYFSQHRPISISCLEHRVPISLATFVSECAYKCIPFFSGFQCSVLLKLETIVKNPEIQIALLQGAASGDREEQMTMLEDMLLDPVNSVQQL